ncbi:hypothetical protein [Trinickia sp.]|uniref:hypothetical protein n=1 Tax=Trinickia sp. TaxID=2571163 RepID=UPI003F7FDEDC
MKLIFMSFIVIGVVGCHSGDQVSVRDRAMGEMAAVMEAASALVVIAPASSPSQRAVLQENLVKRMATYDVLSASAEKLNLLQEARAVMPTVSKDNALGSVELERIIKRTANLTSVGAEALGRLPDMGRRDSVLFKLPTGKLGMLSVWDYREDQGKLFAIEDALRFEVAGTRASLSLSQRPKDNRRLWVVGWITDSEDYTLYLEDAATTDGSTFWNPNSIRALAEEMTR